MSTTNDNEEVHVFETAGIEEGNASVPGWLWLVIATLSIFAVVYIWQYLTGVQPSAADFKPPSEEADPLPPRGAD